MSAKKLLNSGVDACRSALHHKSAPAAALGGSLGCVAGGSVGTATGGALGAMVGVIPAIFTFGLSIPVCCVFGGGVGLLAGATAGTGVGVAGGAAIGHAYHQYKDLSDPYLFPGDRYGRR
eukprot:TRINITY_DN12697_c0_g2_i1.p2 TRINITY_DN12697_c0_g2~~TRINITY_DN12697_c0_g2_i1.p2  ORF type:complete len:120 (-),score=17.69 TRINITY_DN12697_c0_g2_i1:84-443(-)